MLVRLGDREYAAAEGAIYGLLGGSTAHLDANQGLASLPRYERELAIARLLDARRQGATILIATHDEMLLERLVDEIWWLEEHELRDRGEPGVILARYRAHVARLLRESAEGIEPNLAPSIRRGDERASIGQVELLGENGRSTAAWRSGEHATVRVSVQYAHVVANPVIGIMIRTRIGLNVYGTNTELERLSFGPVAAHHAVRIAFRFSCHLCPGEYTLTVASHDPDGTWHDWLEDAVAFSVIDDRYTAGVANLRATATLETPTTRSLEV